MWDSKYPLGALLSRSHLPALDGLRMIAVLIVILGHVNWPVPADLGVSLFFVLSGFLITWLLMKERDRTANVALGTFYLRRAFRLLPAYYVYLALAMAVYLRRPDARTDIIAPSLLYWANYFNATHGHPSTPISHTWSLAVEEQFYLLWPFVFRLLARVSRRALIAFLVGAIVTVGAWRSYLHLGLRVDDAWTYNAFDCRFDNLAVGCLLAVLSPDPRFLAAARVVASHPALPLIPMGAVALLHIASPGGYQHAIGFTVDACLLGLALIQIMQLADHPGWRWLNHRVSRYIGTISYPMYLWHGFGWSTMTRLERFHWPEVVLVAANIATVIVLATMSYYLVEKPCLKLRDRVIARRQSVARAQPAS